MPTYEAEAHLERGWWIVDVPDVGQRVRASTLADVEPAARHLIASARAISATSFGVDIHVSRLFGADVIHARLRFRSVSQLSEDNPRPDARASKPPLPPRDGAENRTG